MSRIFAQFQLWKSWLAVVVAKDFYNDKQNCVNMLFMKCTLFCWHHTLAHYHWPIISIG